MQPYLPGTVQWILLQAVAYVTGVEQLPRAKQDHRVAPQAERCKQPWQQLYVGCARTGTNWNLEPKKLC